MNWNLEVQILDWFSMQCCPKFQFIDYLELFECDDHINLYMNDHNAMVFTRIMNPKLFMSLKFDQFACIIITLFDPIFNRVGCYRSRRKKNASSGENLESSSAGNFSRISSIRLRNAHLPSQVLAISIIYLFTVMLFQLGYHIRDFYYLGNFGSNPCLSLTNSPHLIFISSNIIWNAHWGILGVPLHWVSMEWSHIWTKI